ncbi:DnaJ-domain-containing protein [Neoconidiobolus thromboides FSU 785]|nr:DnaJ-domain-containing protein [Neoconidiobolus thromboides FSU 785]
MRDYYEVLEITRSATDIEIKKAKQYHPDKVTGFEEEFKEISAAYEVLSDPELRANYDQYGFEGNNFAESGGFDPQFANMFNFGFGGFEQGPSKGGKRKSPKVIFPFNVTLKDLYNGREAKFQLEKSVECSLCHGKGGKSSTSTTCQGCEGSGIKIKLKQLSNGMMQQVQVSCESCDGTGKQYKIKDKCKKCKGKRSMTIKKLMEVYVEKGMVDRQKIVFKEEADQIPGKEPGDLIIELALQHHNVFTREGSDLMTNVKIALKDALCGFKSCFFQHLDGRKIQIHANPGQVLIKGSIMVKGEGMPQFKRPYDKGDLFVKFDIQFPTADELKDINLKVSILINNLL